MIEKIQKNDLRKIETPDSKRSLSFTQIKGIIKNNFKRTDTVIKPLRFDNKKEN